MIENKKREIFIILIFLFVIKSSGYLFPYEMRNPLSGSPAPVGTIWPRPTIQNSSQIHFPLNTLGFQIHFFQQNKSLEWSQLHSIHCPVLDWARSHYTQLIRKLRSDSVTDRRRKEMRPEEIIQILRIELESCKDDYPQLDDGSSEHYELIVKQNSIDGRTILRVVASSPWGAIRGLESFYQLTWSHPDDDTLTFINETEVSDRPRFPHRGLMVDTSRHFLPEVTLVKVMTAMMYNKLNVLHFHIVDDQSWPFVSQQFPELSEKGAYNKVAVYTPDVISRIIRAAHVRGIRVIFEFDTPGHVGSLGKSHQELLTPCYGDGKTPGTPDYPYHAAYENLDPTNEQMFDFMQEFYSEIVRNVSKDRFVHLGLDEVYSPCWESSPVIREFMESQGYSEIAQVQEYYIQRLVSMVKAMNVTPIAWQDPVTSGAELDMDVVVQVWQDWSGNRWKTSWERLLQKGYKVILSACWYINYISYGESWKSYYTCDPIINVNVSLDQQSQILGGEAAIWGEFVDQTNIIPRLFPFASAVAEVLWTNRTEIENTEKVKWRLDQFRCSLLRRGIQAQPILNSHCGGFEAKLSF